MPVLTEPITHQRVNVIGLNISLGGYLAVRESIIEAARQRQSNTVCFANVHMTIEGKRDATYADQVNTADWVVPDGLPLTWAIRLLYKQQQDRVAGPDMLVDLIKRAAEEHIPIFFYGSTPDVLEKAVAVCRQRYPSLLVAGTIAPPFRTLTSEEEEQTIDQINGSGAKLVFVALGCPKQERWIARMRGRIQAVMLGVGGGLPILAGVQNRPPLWIQRTGTEWMYRLIKEPRRLFKRYAITNSLFIFYFFNTVKKSKRQRIIFKYRRCKTKIYV